MCHINSAQIKADGQVLADLLDKIAAQPSLDPVAKNALTLAAQGLVNVTSDWKTGTPMSVFDDAMKAVTIAMGLIPITAPFAWAVSLAQVAIDALWANFSAGPVTPTPVSVSSVKGVVAKMELIKTEAPSHWHGLAEIVHLHGESLRDSIVRTYNEEVDKHPNDGFTKIEI